MSHKILIVDDSAFLRKMIADTLTNAGCEIVGEAGSGDEAVEKFRQLGDVDLVTMDVIMLGKGGLQTLKEILFLRPEARVLMLSAMGQQSLVVEAIQAGAKGFIIKPFKPEQLLAEVKRILE